MKKFALVCGILVSVVSLSLGKMSSEEANKAFDNCRNADKSACEALINNGLPSVEQCDKNTSCLAAIAIVYSVAGRDIEAIPYFEKLIALVGENKSCSTFLADTYYNKLKDYRNAKKHFEIVCNKGNVDSVQAWSCNNLGVLYAEGKGVRQNFSTAKQYFGKACDLGYQDGCDNYKLLNQQGVR